MTSVINLTAQAASRHLAPSLSPDAKVLTDASSDEFIESMRRWSDVNVKTPSAILQPACEADAVKIVFHATQNKIPFVAKAGGHSPWSTIGSGGWIIDLSLLTGITLDTTSQTATVQGGVLTKPLNTAVGSAGFCIQSASAGSVGHIPFVLGGGSSWLTGLYGPAVDHLLSARVITATKGLVVASETENQDLFWGLKGAGQFLGLVTEVTVRIFPIEQEPIGWTCIFPPSQVAEVSTVLETLADPRDARTVGTVGILAPPGRSKPIILINILHFRPEAEAAKLMEPLLAIGPVQQIKMVVPFANMTDAAEVLNKQGGLKTQISCGMQSFDGAKFRNSLERWNGLVEEYPSAVGSFFMFNWYGVEAMKSVPDESSAWSHRDCAVWSMSFVTATDEKSASAAVQDAEEFVRMCQADQEETEKAMFPNHTRVHSIEQRYRGLERRRRLGELKKVWDPEGVFTRQFLD